MFLTRCAPTIENRDVLKEYYKKGQAAMICANHNSWMDIPFLGYTAGWRNYKLVSKAELGKVPILGKAIKVGGHVMVDRSSRRSQLQTLKDGMKWLKVSPPTTNHLVCVKTSVWLLIFAVENRMVFISARIQRGLGQRAAVSESSRTVPSRWLTRRVPRSFLCPLWGAQRQCHTTGCSLCVHLIFARWLSTNQSLRMTRQRRNSPKRFEIPSLKDCPMTKSLSYYHHSFLHSLSMLHRVR